MASRGPKQVLVQHDRPPTEAEIAAFTALTQETDRVVLTPTVVNGRPRFSLALLCRTENGEMFLQVLAHLIVPAEEVLACQDMPGETKTRSSREDLN